MKRPNSALALATLGLALLAPAALAGTASRADLTQLDGYGHFGSADPALCAYQPINVDGGTSLNLTAASPSVTAPDDGAAQFALTLPLRFFGTDYSSLVVSSNGYVAFAADVSEENGGDFSNDLYLPAVPDNAAFATARIFAYHDELSGEGAGAALTQQHFASCPRASGLVVGEACTVVEWKNWNRLGNNQPITLQLLLYHTSSAVATQYSVLDASAGASACVGLQSHNAEDGGAWSCNGTRTISAGSAVCFFDPAYLPGSGNDEAIFTDGFES
jgi:hypothetical protein